MKKIYSILLLVSLFVRAFAIPPETSYVANIAVKASGDAIDDDYYGPFNIGFDFNFYGTTYSEFYVSSNGLLTFGSGSWTYSNFCIPSAGDSPDNMICAFWDDLMIDGTGAIYYQTIGAAPNRKLIVQWTNMTMYGLPTLMGTFTAILYETSNEIQIQYRSIVDPLASQPHGSSATIGIENSGGTDAVSYSCETEGAVNTGTALLFTPSGATYTLNSDATYQGVLLVESSPYPGIPQLISPANGATVGLSTNFQWSAATNATSYSLQISANSDLSDPTSYSAGTATNYTPPDFTDGDVEYWSVWATNSSGTTWSEIRQITFSSNAPLAAVPQTYYVELTQDIPIQISYTGGDANAKTAIITVLPTDGALYQYNNGARGDQITTVPTTLTDASLRLIYAATGTSGNGKGNFNVMVHDGTGDSPEITTIINVSPLGAPNFLSASKSDNTIEIQFDRLMGDPTGKEAQFTVTDDNGAVSITSAALKAGDTTTIVLTMATTLTGTVSLAYTAGTIASKVGGLLLSFSAQIVSLTLQAISFDALATKTYGDAAFDLTATASSGLDITFSSSNTSVATISGTTCTLTGAGTTTITATQAGDGTYASATYSQVLTVTPFTLTVADALVISKIYDGTTLAGITGAALSGVIGSDVVSLDNATLGTFASANVGTDIAVTTAMTISGSNSGNYLITQPDLTGNITVLSLTISNAAATNKVYDGLTSDTIKGATLDGVVLDDDVSLTDTIGTFADVNAGDGIAVTVNMTLTGTAAANYTIESQPTGLVANITAKELSVTAENKSKTYGQANPELTVTYAGFAGDETASVLITAPVATTEATQFSNVNTYDIVPAGGEAANYTFAYTNGTLTIIKAELSVTADNASRTYGEVNPELTVTYVGFVGDESASVLTTAPVATTEATQYSDVNMYNIVPAGGEAANYSFVYTNGTLTVNKAELSVTADNASRAFGEANPAFTLSYSGFLGTDDANAIDELPTATCEATTSSAAGDYDIVLAGGSDNNYALTLHNGVLTVTPATAVPGMQADAVTTYPNPATNNIFINNVPENTTITLVNLQGTVVKSAISTSSIEKIDVSALPSGVYFIKLSGKEIDKTIRIVKQ